MGSMRGKKPPPFPEYAVLGELIEQIVGEIAQKVGADFTVDSLVRRRTDQALRRRIVSLQHTSRIERRVTLEHDRTISEWVWRAPLDILELLLSMTEELARAASWHPTRPARPVKLRTLHDLLMRTVQVGREVELLLLAGFPDGALARWRSMHELNVVATVLACEDSSASERYAHHEAVMAERDVRHLIAAGEGGRRTRRQRRRRREVVARHESLVRRRDELLERYGREFARPYGWAADITSRKLGVKDPKFTHLERLALPHDKGMSIRLAHRHVHAASTAADFAWHSAPPGQEVELGAAPGRVGLVGMFVCETLGTCAAVFAEVCAHELPEAAGRWPVYREMILRTAKEAAALFSDIRAGLHRLGIRA